MQYDWEEEDFSTVMDAAIDEAFIAHGEKYRVVGVLIENTEHCEGAIVVSGKHPEAGLKMCDLWEDFLGDAQGRWEHAVRETSFFTSEEMEDEDNEAT